MAVLGHLASPRLYSARRVRKTDGEGGKGGKGDRARVAWVTEKRWSLRDRARDYGKAAKGERIKRGATRPASDHTAAAAAATADRFSSFFFLLLVLFRGAHLPGYSIRARARER